MSAPERFDVVIVGARCAGAATAMLLARQGHRVLVLDRAARGSDTLSTHALMRGGVLQLQRWGLLDHIAAAGTPAIRQVRFHYGDESTTVPIKPSAGVDALYAPRRTLLDRVLVDAAVAAGAQVRFGVNVTGLDRDPEGRVVGVVGRDRRGRPVRAHGRLTVGADGKRSMVAREAGAATQWTGTGSAAAVYGYWAGLDVAGYEWLYRPGAAAGLIPTNDGKVCVFAGTTTARFGDEIAGDLAAGYLRLLKEVVGDVIPGLQAGQPPSRLRAFPGLPGYVRRPSGLGWALVGDAGQYLDPLGAHGITDALRDAELLARAAGALLAGADETAALREYEANRDRMTGPMFAVLDEIAGYRWTLPAVRQLLLAHSNAMGDEVDALAALPVSSC
ncbi:MAG TPA: NAD(P)/FAD-dependent oxidoreductase [Pseudonocardiaceae bacterium]|jgi:flavin-dependent dehydrogenase